MAFDVGMEFSIVVESSFDFVMALEIEGALEIGFVVGIEVEVQIDGYSSCSLDSLVRAFRSMGMA
jgi:hypothetical protein